MNTSSRSQRFRRTISVAVFCCVAAVLLGWLAYLAAIRRDTAREIAKVEQRRDALRAVVRRWESERQQVEAQSKQAEQDARLVFNVLGHCRSAEDIPGLNSDRIVSRHQGHGELRFYVPEGTHTLEITSGLKPQGGQAGETSPQADAERGGFTGMKGWSVPLLPSSGYHLQLHTDRQGGSLRWELASNHVAFESREASLGLEDFIHRGSSWSDFDVLLFPNQVEQYSVREIEAAAASPPGVQLLDMKLRGSIQESFHEVTFAVRVISEGPACVSAHDAYRLIRMNRKDLLQPYKGQGKYQLKSK